MRLLLDTHALIWHYEDSPAISEKAGQAMENLANQIFISAASIWEMAIKVSSGKLTLTNSIREILSAYQSEGAALLAISLNMPWLPRHCPGATATRSTGY